MDTNTYAPIPGIEGAAARIEALTEAEHAANGARLKAYDEIRAPYDAACKAAFEAHGAGPEHDAAHAALCLAMEGIDTHPDYAPADAAHSAAREAVTAAALAYMQATRLPAILLRIHTGGGWPYAGPDVEAVLWALPEGPVPGLAGWRKVTVSPQGAWNSAREVRLCYQRTVVVSASEGRSRITDSEEEAQRLADDRARNRANHDIYLAQLARVREALDTTPALAGTVCAAAGAEEIPAAVLDAAELITGVPISLDEPRLPAGAEHLRPALEGYEAWAAGAHARAELAGVCLALAGWRYCPGQEGGTLTPPWGGVAVTMRGALRLPRGSK